MATRKFYILPVAHITFLPDGAKWTMTLNDNMPSHPAHGQAAGKSWTWAVAHQVPTNVMPSPQSRRKETLGGKA